MKRDLPQGFSRAVPIGEGAFGTVFRARQDDLGRWVALKGIRRGDKTAREEAQALAAAPLAPLPTVFGLVAAKKSDWISMEYVHGVSLRDLMQFGLEPRESAGICAALVRSVAVLHSAGRSHGDIKPENAILQSDGKVRLVDLGFSASASGIAVQGGTAGYLAPEIGSGGTDPRRADVWSIGVVLHELLVGARPSATERGGGWKRLALQAPDWIPLVDLLLREDPAKRPASADTVLGELPDTPVFGVAFLERVREQADRNLASRMVEEAGRLLDERIPSAALVLLQQALELDPDQSAALAMLPKVRLGGGAPSRSRRIAFAAAVALVAAIVVGFALHRRSAARPPRSIPVEMVETKERLRPDRNRQDRTPGAVPLREGKGDSP